MDNNENVKGKVILWDFDGTLGGRIDGEYGRAWSMAMLEAIYDIYPNSRIIVEEIDPLITSDFPWHMHEQDHLHLNTAERWWEYIRSIFIRCYSALGFSQKEAAELAFLAQHKYLDLNKWALYDDTLPVLQQLGAEGWKHIIVSNHAPELDEIIEHLGLTPWLDGVVNSAIVGYEKPHRVIFEKALEVAGQADRQANGRANGQANRRANVLWMVGDNINADVFGAEQLGIKAILVRNIDDRAKFNAKDLYEAARIIEAE